MLRCPIRSKVASCPSSNLHEEPSYLMAQKHEQFAIKNMNNNINCLLIMNSDSIILVQKYKDLAVKQCITPTSSCLCWSNNNFCLS